MPANVCELSLADVPLTWSEGSSCMLPVPLDIVHRISIAQLLSRLVVSSSAANVVGGRDVNREPQADIVILGCWMGPSWCLQRRE